MTQTNNSNDWTPLSVFCKAHNHDFKEGNCTLKKEDGERRMYDYFNEDDLKNYTVSFWTSKSDGKRYANISNGYYKKGTIESVEKYNL